MLHHKALTNAAPLLNSPNPTDWELAKLSLLALDIPLNDIVVEFVSQKGYGGNVATAFLREALFHQFALSTEELSHIYRRQYELWRESENPRLSFFRQSAAMDWLDKYIGMRYYDLRSSSSRRLNPDVRQGHVTVDVAPRRGLPATHSGIYPPNHTLSTESIVYEKLELSIHIYGAGRDYYIFYACPFEKDYIQRQMDIKEKTAKEILQDLGIEFFYHFRKK